MNKKIKFKRICIDCKKEKHIITHHIITKKMRNYLIVICGYDRKSIYNLRNQLTVEICKECEKKFHNDDYIIDKNLLGGNKNVNN